MIISRLRGRLGNQMFQYAAARALAHRLSVPVALDSREAQKRGEGVLTRVFDLPHVAPSHLPPARKGAPLRYMLWWYAGLSPRLRRERGLGFNPEFEIWSDDSYLHGYWQSERYFKEIADQIRADFTFPDFEDSENRDMAARIAEATSVSLHVRRGDYVSLAAHVLCDQTYYDAALSAILEKVSGSVRVFVFSDDPDWAKANLPLPCEKIVVDFNGSERDYEDLRLMSLCDHNIIANSSFSWWGAWLNANPDKQVAGPVRWFGDPALNNPDILPGGWMRIAPPQGEARAEGRTAGT